MTTATALLTDQVLSLPCEDRIYLVDRLLESLNAPCREDIDRLWAEEAERRIDELDSGRVAHSHRRPGYWSSRLTGEGERNGSIPTP